jgi:hypothetical protein
MPAPARTDVSTFSARRSVRRAVALASAVALVATGSSSTATAKPNVKPNAKVAAAAKSGPKPGVDGKVITIATHDSFGVTGRRNWDLGVDHSGTAYLTWLAATKNSTTERHLFFCTLPLGARACKGGIQDKMVPDPGSIGDLRLLVSPKGVATILWYASDASSGTGVFESTSDSGAPLTAARLVVKGPSAGSLLDAEVGPNAEIWTVIQQADIGKVLDVRRSLTGSPEIVKDPTKFGVGDASLAFDKKTAILVISQYGQNVYPLYTSSKGTSWTAFKKVNGTETGYGINPELTSTRSGVILTTVSRPHFYQPVTAKWNGHGFGKPIFTGDHNPCDPGSHDVSTDASGRAVDVTNECGEITVANLVDTRHAAVVRFGAPKSATVAGGDPQIISTPRGHAWVAWGIESSSAGGSGDTLKVVPFLLSGLDTHKSGHGSHGTVTVTGPKPCQPASSIKVGVKSHAAHGWKVLKSTLKLGKKKIGKTLNGAKLKPGMTYTLKGSVVFSDGHGHSSAKASLKFRACPKP